MERLEDIDREAYPDKFWTKKNFEKYFDKDDFFTYVAVSNAIISGYILCGQTNNSIVIAKMGVDRLLRRERIGSRLLYKVHKKLNREVNSIYTITRDTNLPAHLFLKNQGYQAVKIKWGFFKDLDDSIKDGYLFKYSLEDFYGKTKRN